MKRKKNRRTRPPARRAPDAPAGEDTPPIPEAPPPHSTAKGVTTSTVPAEYASTRLDQYLARWSDVGSRNRAQRLLRSGKVDVDGVTVSPQGVGTPLAAGANVELHWSRPGTAKGATRSRAELARIDLEVLYEDAHLIAINKPAGLLTDAATRKQQRERATATQAVNKFLSARGARATAVHRIDRDTSGVVLFAKTSLATEHLRTQFRHHTPERVYWVALQGTPSPYEGTWEDLTIWDERNRVQRLAHPKEKRAQRAQLTYRVRTPTTAECSVVEVQLYTGRRNQIRLQAQLRGCPLIGERLYLTEEWVDRGPSAPRQALHAARLGIEHPTTGTQLQIEAPLPDDLQAIDDWCTKRALLRS